MGNLSGLHYLFLYSNQLSGLIPSEFGNLSSLQELLLGINQLSGVIPAAIGNLSSLRILHLSSNQLSGSIPPELVNLTKLLVYPYTGIDYKALWTKNPAVRAFLASKDPDWDQTQTVAPEDVAASLPTSSSVVLEWTPIDYATDAGAYAVFLHPAPQSDAIFHDGFEGGDTEWWGLGNPWVTTTDKTDTSILVDGLEPGTTYNFVVRTITEPHASNQNQVISNASATEATAP